MEAGSIARQAEQDERRKKSCAPPQVVGIAATQNHLNVPTVNVAFACQMLAQDLATFVSPTVARKGCCKHQRRQWQAGIGRNRLACRQYGRTRSI